MLKNLAGNIVADIFRAADMTVQYLIISRCSLGSLRLLRGFSLTLQDISAEWDLRGTLKHWSGRELKILRCPTFDDELLAAMADGDLANRDFMCPALTALHLYNCNFSSIALKNMLEARIMASKDEVGWTDILEASDFDFENAAPIDTLAVFGGGPLSQEDEKWFKANVYNFYWCVDPYQRSLEYETNPNGYSTYGS
ncbi:hypothetical protein BV22DRAFT_569816 [Leucogyrophana mollusca]|uniref:Uncharacterized protein n=1 Tax=Leucogyrophana mollusca TaxID=85980 RepID=A0ACB8BEN4_9AGAM|nr:hypothetical protein BV22DRAFT_569816 [Leucogyrophana mollusca]